MSHISPRSIMIAELCFVLLIASASGLQQQEQLQQSNGGAMNQQPSESVPSSLSNGLADNQKAQTASPANWPLVNVDNANNKSVVDVHVPIFFDMVNQADKNAGTEKLDLSVMHGLVTVKKDKTRNPNGELSGPVKVTVFGIPVYTSKNAQEASSGSSSTRMFPEDPKRFEPMGAIGQTGNYSSLTTEVKAINERLTSSLTDLLNRISGNLRRIGAPANDQISVDSTRAQTGRQEQLGMNEVNVEKGENRTF